MEHTTQPVLTIALGANRFEVENLAHASRMLREYVRNNNLGGSEMRKGDGAVRAGKRKVAHVSYNGRVWTADGATLLAERAE